jgi:sulfite reductase (NADPH) hemoprotein beta-component
LANIRFKITIAVPPVNDTDVYAHDIGLIAIKDESTGGLAGFNVLIGGGMGMTHGSKKTYARLGQLLGFSTPKDVSEVCEAVMLVQRDNGDRTNRKHARYLPDLWC